VFPLAHSLRRIVGALNGYGDLADPVVIGVKLYLDA